MLCEDGDPVAMLVNTANFGGAHFAAFPTDLVHPLIACSTSERGCCPECGSQWERVVEHVRRTKTDEFCPKHLQGKTSGLSNPGWRKRETPNAHSTTLGWRPVCQCHLLCGIMDSSPNQGGRNATQGQRARKGMASGMVSKEIQDRPEVQSSGGETKAKIPNHLQDVRQGGDGEEGCQVLQPSMFDAVDVEKRTGKQVHTDGQGIEEPEICDGIRGQRSSDGTEIWKGIRTSSCNVSTLETSVKKLGICTSPKWRQERQQAGESCDCDDWRARQGAHDKTEEGYLVPIPATILDPFSGAGTTLLEADRMGRNAVGIDISRVYAEMTRDRVAGDAPMFADVEIVENA